MNKRNKIEAGFTFMEIMIVVIIISVLSAVGFPAMKKVFSGGQLKSSTRELYTMLKYAQGSAVFQRKIAMIRIDTKNNRYRLVSDEDEEGSRRRRRSEAQSRIYRAVYLPDSVWFEKVSIPGEEESSEEVKSILFYPDGTSSGAEIVIKGNKPKGLMIQIYRTTGFIELTSEKGEDIDPGL